MRKSYCVKLMKRPDGLHAPNPTQPYVGNGISGEIWITYDINEAHKEASSKSGWFNVMVEECL